LGTDLDTYEAQDSVNTYRENVRVFLEGSYDIRPDLTATTRLNYSRNETTTSSLIGGFGLASADNVSTNKGFGGGFAITKTLKNGTIGADFDSNVTSSGRRDTARVTRAIKLPNGDFSMSLGAVRPEGSDLQPLINLSYSQDLVRGKLGLGLSQRTSTGDDDETVINTRLRASYDQEINPSSSWGLTARLADTDAVDLADNTRRLDLGVNYRHELAQDWDLVANYTYSSSKQTGEAQRSSNTVSLSIAKSFQFRP
jgi:hypothetical protein